MTNETDLPDPDDIVFEHDTSPSGRISNFRAVPVWKVRERRLVEKTVDALLKAGYVLSVFDGRYETVTRTTVRDVILAGMQTTGVDHLLVYRGESQEAEGWVRLAYVNGEGSPTITRSPSLGD